MPAAAVDAVTAALVKKGKFVKNNNSGTMKKPAAAGGGLKASIGKMQAGCPEDDDHRGDEQKEDSCAESARDKGNGEKFASMLKSNQLPSHVQYLYQDVANTKASPREFRAMIINTLFERKKNGRFELRDDRPLFTEAKELYERKYWWPILVW